MMSDACIGAPVMIQPRWEVYPFLQLCSIYNLLSYIPHLLVLYPRSNKVNKHTALRLHLPHPCLGFPPLSDVRLAGVPNKFCCFASSSLLSGLTSPRYGVVYGPSF